MGLDLRLHPLEHLSGSPDEPLGFSHTVLRVVGPCRTIHDRVKAYTTTLPPKHNIHAYHARKVPDGSFEGEGCYGKFDATDPYGHPYSWVQAGFLLPILQNLMPDAPVTKYVGALQASTQIILGWY